MSKVFSGPGARCLALALAFVFVPAAVHAADWGTVTGQVVLGDPIPKNDKAKVDKDQGHCLSKGAILKNELVVDKDSKGVRWAVVWLTGVDDPKGTKPIPVHPSLVKKAASITIDQPCCAFEPRVIGMQEGQTLIVKNSSPIAHNSNMNFSPLGPAVNPLIPSKSEYEVKGIKARYMPTSYSCSIHSWMKGWVGVFKHPYFAVTDKDGKFTIKNAPAGKYRLMVWHEQGWVIINPKDLKDRGKIITIKPNATTDVGKITFKLPKD